MILISLSGISILPIYSPITLFGTQMRINIADQIFAFLFSSLIDLDHLIVFKKLGPKGFIRAEKIIPSPLHNIFFLFIFSASSAVSAIFFSRTLAVLLFSIVLHMGWDFLEDVVIFGINYKRWEHVHSDINLEIEKFKKKMKKTSFAED